MDERKSKKILLVITIFISFIAITKCSIVYASSVSVKSQTPEFYVNDFADIFTAEQEQEMLQKAIDLESSYNGIQVVVTTVKSLEGSSPQEYAYTMYNQYGIGKDSMGILILLATEDRQVRIETGQKMQMYITDSLSGRILDDYAMAHLKENRFAEGIINTQSAVIENIKERVPVDWHEQKSVVNNTTSVDFGALMLNFLLIVILPAGVIVLVIFAVKKIKKAREEKVQKIISKNNKEWQDKLERKQLEHDLETENIRTEKNMIENDNHNLERKNEELCNRLEEMESKYERILKLHPNIETEIYQMIQDEFKDEAQKYDSQYSEVLQIEPSIKGKKRIKEAINSFEKLPDEAKKYSKTDIEHLEMLYEDCIRLENEKIADTAYNQISSYLDSHTEADYTNYSKLAGLAALFAALTTDQKICIVKKDDTLLCRLTKANNIAKEDYISYTNALEVKDNMTGMIETIIYPDRYDVEGLENEINSYESLSDRQKSFIPIELYEQLKELLRKAKQDEDDYERKRREQNRINSINNSRRSSSFTTTRSFHGHGGRSGGGGAGRGF